MVAYHYSGCVSILKATFKETLVAHKHMGLCSILVAHETLAKSRHSRLAFGSAMGDQAPFLGGSGYIIYMHHRANAQETATIIVSHSMWTPRIVPKSGAAKL